MVTVKDRKGRTSVLYRYYFVLYRYLLMHQFPKKLNFFINQKGKSHCLFCYEIINNKHLKKTFYIRKKRPGPFVLSKIGSQKAEILDILAKHLKFSNLSMSDALSHIITFKYACNHIMKMHFGHLSYNILYLS